MPRATDHKFTGMLALASCCGLRHIDPLLPVPAMLHKPHLLPSRSEEHPCVPRSRLALTGKLHVEVITTFRLLPMSLALARYKCWLRKKRERTHTAIDRQ